MVRTSQCQFFVSWIASSRPQLGLPLLALAGMRLLVEHRTSYSERQLHSWRHAACEATKELPVVRKRRSARGRSTDVFAQTKERSGTMFSADGTRCGQCEASAKVTIAESASDDCKPCGEVTTFPSWLSRPPANPLIIHNRLESTHQELHVSAQAVM